MHAGVSGWDEKSVMALRERTIRTKSPSYLCCARMRQIPSVDTCIKSNCKDGIVEHRIVQFQNCTDVRIISSFRDIHDGYAKLSKPHYPTRFYQHLDSTSGEEGDRNPILTEPVQRRTMEHEACPGIRIASPHSHLPHRLTQCPSQVDCVGPRGLSFAQLHFDAGVEMA